MKRKIAMGLVILLGAGTVFLASCQKNEFSVYNAEVGLNGSFETTRDGYPVNWSFFPNPCLDEGLRVFLDSEDAVDGKQCLKVTAKQSDKTTGFRSFRIPIEPGKKYKLSMSVKSDGCTLRVNRVVRDASGKRNLRANIIVRTSEPSPEWIRYDGTLTAREDETYVNLIFLINGSGSLWCDNVRFEEVSE